MNYFERLSGIHLFYFYEMDMKSIRLSHILFGLTKLKLNKFNKFNKLSFNWFWFNVGT